MTVPATVDYNGLAVLITALTGLVAGLGTIILQAISISRQTTNAQSQGQKLDDIHDCLHEATQAVKAAVGEKAEEVKTVITDAVGKN